MIAFEHNPTSVIAPLALVLALLLAVRQDLVAHRISNWLTIGAFAVGVLINSLADGANGIAYALAGAGTGLVCLLPLYLAKGMGAGDVKLMTAAGTFLGPFNAFVAALLSLTFGAVLAISVVIWRVIGIRTAGAGPAGGPMLGMRTALSVAGKERFPYAAAIALGVAATMWLRGMLDPVIRSLT